MSNIPDRHVTLQGSANFRDIGGYAAANGHTVRWRRLYRSDGLSHLTDDDLAVLAPIGMNSILDLRSLDEVTNHGPSTLVASHGARHHHLPFIRENISAAGYSDLPALDVMYEEMLEHGGATIRAVFELLTDDATYPAVVHCTVGKDRTGVAVALVLRTLGVNDATIAADYALTERATERLMAKLVMLRSGNPGPFRNDLMSADAANMVGLLGIIDTRFGGTDQLLRDAGVPSGAGEQLRALLLEP